LKKKQKGFPLQSGLNKKEWAFGQRHQKKRYLWVFNTLLKVYFKKILERYAG
jgi:hypothetical protein